MKKFYFAVTLVVLSLSVAFIGYGMYLNSVSNSHIETMLASRAVSLSGIRVSYRSLYPELYLAHINMRTKNQADIIAEIDGLIEELHVVQGHEIERGQSLGRIVNRDVQLTIARAGTEIARAEAAYLQAQSTAERNRRLASEDAISKSELEMSVSQMNASRAELDAARIARRQAEQQMRYQTVTSPLSGTVLMLYQNSGNFVAQGTPIVMIADFSKMNFTVMVNDMDMRNIAPIEGEFTLHMEQKRDSTALSAAIANMSGRTSFGENAAYNLEISSISPPLSESTSVRRITGEVDNHLGVIEIGMYADAIIRKGSSKMVLTVPRAIVFKQGGAKVYVRDENSKLAVRGIITGAYDSEYVEVVEGLKEGDIVITSGIDGLNPGMRIEVNVEGTVY